VGDSICEIFGGITHLVWSFFWVWTGLEGYFLYFSVTHVFESFQIEVKRPLRFFTIIGYSLPILLVAILLGCSFGLDLELYIRKFGCSTSCWLDAKYIWIYLSTVALVIAWNIAVTVRATSASYQSAKLRNTSLLERYLSGLRNIIVLSIMLGLGSILGFIPVVDGNETTKYLFAVMNSSSGVFIFLISVLLNKETRKELLESLSSAKSSSLKTLKRIFRISTNKLYKE